MASISFKRGTKKELEIQPLTNGLVSFTTDDGRIHLDYMDDECDALIKKDEKKKIKAKIEENNKTIEELISDVCSKGGTTIEGIQSLRKSHLDKTITKCFKKTYKRSKELSKIK